MRNSIAIAITIFAMVRAEGSPPAQNRSSSRADWVRTHRLQHPDVYSDENVYEDATLSVPDLIRKYGYPSEIHHVTTRDNYILEMHRIPHGRDNNDDPNALRPVVFIMHGLISSSADFIIMGPERSIGYILAEKGYDVWLGNARGNYYSRAHTRYDPNRSSKFWNFSWDEIGNHDISAMVDYVLATTGQLALHYIGHSQGTTSFLVLTSLRPKYNDKFKSVHLMAPVAYMENFPSEELANYARLSTTIANIGKFVGVGETFAKETVFTFNDKGEILCIDDNSFINFCRWLIPEPFSAKNLAEFPIEMLPVILGHTPAGSALKQFAHYGQIINSKTFRRWSYTTRLQNLLAYGSFRTPFYNVNNVRADVTLYYSVTDSVASEQDVLALAASLQKGKARRVQFDNFTHFDFAWGVRAKKLVYDYILDGISEYERTK
ncbi:Lipase 3 [Eumeta japonica]|uniref:Lipase n=1 Tax=Eumeta variegata TaxID=151549 RepID=A0A4C1VPJ5_EUMVA|nr:Lipase 3 [Eumeta japonica]